MNTSKSVNVASILRGLNTTELKELRKQFNSEVSNTMHVLAEKERLELESFINSLDLTNRYRKEGRNVVSINYYRLTGEDRQMARAINDRISSAFKDLERLKLRIAVDTKARGLPNSEVFYSSIKRMTRFKNGGY